MLKALPLAYNRDLQEDKRAVFETEDTLLDTLTVFAAMVPELQFDAARGRKAATADYALATDIADFLVRKGMPFREAHGVVGRLVQYAEEQGKTFAQLSDEELKRFSPILTLKASRVTLAESLRARDVPGGTSPRRVGAALRHWKRRLGEN
jgi:argininosuccinate lyase